MFRFRVEEFREGRRPCPRREVDLEVLWSLCKGE